MDNIPHHIAIICDGNRRWAREKGLKTFFGHKKGDDALMVVSRHLRKLGVHTLTAWVFSTENWDRSPEEVGYLMKLFKESLDKHLQELIESNVRIIHLGRKDRMPKELLEKIISAEEKTKHCTGYVFNIALDYGGQDEIIRGIKKLSQSSQSLQELDAASFSTFLDTHDQPYPNPDIVIRTGGEMRLSGFLLWQIAYAELFFEQEMFPDLSEAVIDRVLSEYSLRQRRFGK